MERTRNTTSGRYANEQSPEDILNEMEPGEIYATGQLSALTGIAHRTTLKYLNELADKGRVEKKMPNANTAIWIREE